MPSPSFTRSPLPIALLLAAACSDDQICAPIGCIQGVSVYLQNATALPAGSYEIEVAFGGEVVVCHRTLPRDDQVVEDCPPESPLYVSIIQPPLGDIDGFFFDLRDTPASVDVTLRYEDAVIVSESVHPEYQTFENCGLRCTSASEQVRLSVD